MFLMFASYFSLINPSSLLLFVSIHNMHAQTPRADGEDEPVSPPAPGDVAGRPAIGQPDVGAAPGAV